MVIRWFPLFVNMSALSCIICIVGLDVFMSVSSYIHLDVFGQVVIVVVLVFILCL
jgi:hypothetical protein